MIKEKDIEVFNDERVKILLQQPAVARKGKETVIEDIPPIDVQLPGEREIPSHISEEDIIGAMKKKQDGNKAYSMKEFETAIECYNDASFLDPTDPAFLANKAAVYVEMNKYDEAQSCCHLAIKLSMNYGSDKKLFCKTLRPTWCM